MGYYKQGKKTSEAYVQNPINDRYLEIYTEWVTWYVLINTGELEYVGRKDFQIKHMGKKN